MLLGAIPLGVAACRRAGAEMRSSSATQSTSTTRGVAFPIGSVGLQLYTVRVLMQKDAARTTRQLGALGYTLVETAGLYGHTAEAFRRLLDDAGLRSPAGHYAYETLDRDASSVFATAHALGQEWIVVPSPPQGQQHTGAGFRELATRFDRLGRRCKDEGFRFAYHNHADDFRTLEDGRPAYDTLIEATDPALVAFELDAYWAYKAGHDPVSYVDRYPGRFSLCHLKDGTAAPARAMVDVGDGVIDFKSLLARAGHVGLRYAFVEHDEPTDAVASVRRSREFLARLLGASG